MRKHIALLLLLCLAATLSHAQNTLGLNFDGVNDRATIPFNSNYNRGTGLFTIEAWIKADVTQPNAEPTIFSNREAANANTGIQIFLLNGKLTMRIGGTITTSVGNDLRDGNCHHIAVRRANSGSPGFFIDGVYYSGGSGFNQNVNTTHDVWLGLDEPTAATSRFKGVIHELRFWNIAQSNQIGYNLHSYLAGNETSLIGYWRMNDNVQALDDLTSVNNNGYLGTTTSVETSDPAYVTGCMCTTTASINSSGGTVICNASGITLNATSGTGLSYQWKLNGQGISGATSSTYNALTAGVYTCLIYTATCGNTSNAITLTATNPSVSISYTGNLYLCTGSSVTFTSNVTNGGTPTYQWKLNGSNIAGATSSTYIATQAGNYTLLVTNTTNGCSALSNNSYTVTVFTAVPNASISFTSNSSNCNYVAMQITGGTVNGNTYQWQLNGSNISGQTYTSCNATTTGQYRCEVTNACGTSYTNTLSPTITGTGAITYTGNTTVCTGTLQLVATFIQNAAYQWYHDNNLINGANSYSFSASGAGVYNCQIITDDCGILYSSNNVTLDGAPFISANGPLDFCTGGVTLKANGGTTATGYQWKNNGVNISGATTSTYYATTSGSYSCEVVSTLCGIKLSNVLNVTTGVPTQVDVLYGNSGSYMDICNGFGNLLAVPCCAGTYTMRDLMTGYPLISQTNNDFYSPGTGYYLIELDNGCGVTQSNSFGVRDINSSHSVISDGPTSFCNSSAPPNLYVGTYNWMVGQQIYGPAWDTYVWKLNGVVIPNGQFPMPIQPTQTGWYSCAISNSCGNASYVDSLYITVYQAPAAVNVTASGPLTFCQGQSVTFTSSTTSGATYTWFRNGSSVQSGASNVYTATTTGTYKVGVTNGTCGVVYSSDFVVTVNIPPSQYVSTNSPATLCSPGSITMTAPVGSTYEWYRSQTTGIIGTSSTYVATQSGNYYVKVADAQGCYFYSYQQTVSIANPVTITPTQYSSTCENGNVQLQIDFVGAVLSYQWKKNGVAISGATGNYYTFQGGASATGNYTVDVTTECGIIPSNTYNYSTYIPFSATSTPSGNITVCSPATVTLSATTGSNLTYQWYKDNISISGATNATYVANSSGKYGVYITNTVTGCFVNTSNSNPAIINYGNIVPSITPTTGTQFCNSVTLSANGVGGDTYQWRKNSANISGATSQTYVATTTGTYSVVITNSCGTPSIVSKVVYIATAPLTGLTITSASPNPQCSGIGVSMSVSPAQTSGSVTYQWKLNGTAIANALNSTYSASTNGGSYTCDVTNGCGTTTTTAYNLTFNPAPTASITASGTTNLCNGASVTLNAATGTGYSYQWLSNGFSISGATNSSYTTSAGGTYRCRVTNANSCSATSGFINVFTSTGTAPTASISPAGTVNICTGATQTLTANSGSGFTYQWKKNGTNISGATAITYGAITSGTYTVVVTSACGSATSAATTVNVGTTATATITPVGPTTVCSGNVVLNANTGTGLSYQWKNNGVNISGATTASYTATTSGSYTVVVTATGGCSATSAATVVTIGALTAALSPSGTVTLCSGTSTTLSATAGAGYTYQWYRNNVLLSATGQTFTTSTAGTYKCVVTTGTCTATSNSVVVVVNTIPNATVSYSTPLTFCSPGSVTFTANTLSGVTYQWENNSVAIAGATAQTYVATGAGVYRVKETKNGCVDYSSTKTVTTATSVTAAITTPNPTTQCAGGVVNMSVTSPIPGYTHQWKKNNVNIAGATGTTYAATTTGSYTVAITAGCGTATSNSIAVTIGTVSAVVSPAGNATLCTGGSLTLSANTGTGYTHQWKKNNVNIAGATSSTYAVTTAGSYTVTITAPCGSATSSATVVTQAATITASVTPAGTSTICSGSSITYTANAGTGYTYKWYRNNVLLSATGQTFTTATAGSYKVEVSISGSCAVQSNTVTLTVINNPTPTITAGGPTTFCAGQSVTFTTNAVTGATYQWQKNSVNIAGATAQTFIATTAGSYRVQHTKNGCSKYSSKKTVTVNCRLDNNGNEISSDETANEITMQVYPNPFAEKLSIEIASPQTEQVEIKVIDVLGKVQYTQTTTTNTTTELTTNLPAGVYMITSIIDGQMKTVRVVKER